MEQIPLYMAFLQSFLETLILIYIGFALTGTKVSDRKIIFISLVSTVASFFIRMLPILPGVNVLIQLPVLIVLLFLVSKLSLSILMTSIILGFLCVSFAEMLFIPLMSYISGIPVQEALASPFWHIVFPLPEFILLTLLIIYFRRSNINIYRIFKFDRLDFQLYRKSLFILSFSVVLVVLAFYFIFFIEKKQLISDSILTVLILVILIATALSLILSWKLLYVAKQEKIVEIQQFHITNLQEMLQIIKAQRHDFVNHLQAIYGLVSLGHNEQVKDYIKTLYKDVQITGNILQLAFPELSALLLVKTGVATAHNISLEIHQTSNLSSLMVPTMELVTVVGNLLNNAIEAIEEFDPELRIVKLKIYEKSGLYIIQTQNPGYIPLEIKNKVFDAGFSTKAGDRGIGLASIKYQVKKHNGIILVSSHPENGTKFTVCYPSRRKEI